jgi:hypothetical protein
MNAQPRTSQRDQRYSDRIESERQALRQLTQEMSNQWRRALGGLVALPSAVALGFASAAMYVGLFVEVGFQVFERAAGSVQRGAETLRFDEPSTRANEETTRDQPRA